MTATVTAEIQAIYRAVCPACSTASFTIDHEPGRYGPWGCERCGARWLFDIDMPTVIMTRVSPDNEPGWLVVRIGLDEPPIYAVVDHQFYDCSPKDTPEERDDRTRYWVEEHTCPTNIVPISAFVTDGDSDPHGILTFVAHIPKAHWPQDDDGTPLAGWAALINSATGNQ